MILCDLFIFLLWLLLEISGGGKGSDEEHITYSGGQEIFDLLRCGWEEKRKREKKEK